MARSNPLVIKKLRNRNVRSKTAHNVRISTCLGQSAYHAPYGEPGDDAFAVLFPLKGQTDGLAEAGQILVRELLRALLTLKSIPRQGNHPEEDPKEF